MTNWTSYLAALAPPRLRGYWGSRYVAALARLADAVSEGAAQAYKSALLGEATSPDDALPPIALERGLERYPGESAAAHRARLLDAWNIWAAAGDETGIDGQIAAAGLDGAVFLQPGHPGPAPDFATPYWSQFWISTTETSAAAHTTIRRIVATFKPVDWILRYLVVDTPSLVSCVGDSFAVGAEEAVGA